MGELKQIVLCKFHNYLDVFLDQTGADHLPPHREYDQTIHLVPGANLNVAPLYQLSKHES